MSFLLGAVISLSIFLFFHDLSSPVIPPENPNKLNTKFKIPVKNLEDLTASNISNQKVFLSVASTQLYLSKLSSKLLDNALVCSKKVSVFFKTQSSFFTVSGDSTIWIDQISFWSLFFWEASFCSNSVWESSCPFKSGRLNCDQVILLMSNLSFSQIGFCITFS